MSQSHLKATKHSRLSARRSPQVASAGTPVKELSKQSADERARILIVDDDLDMLESLKALFELKPGYEVATATDAARAQEIAAKFAPNIALIDVALPVGDGLDLIPTLKHNDPSIVCVVMTAHRTTQHAVKAVRRGADDYLYKPLEPTSLMQTLRRHIGRQCLERERNESERRFRAIFDQTFQLLFLLDAEGTLLEANGTALSFSATTNKEGVLGRPFWHGPWWRSGCPHTAAATQQRLKAAVAQAAQGKFVREEFEMLGADGRPVIMDFSFKPIRDDNGQVVLIIPEGRDITSRKRAEERLRLAGEVIKSTAEAIVITDSAANIVDVNPAFSEVTGYSREDALGRNPSFMSSGLHDKKFYQKMWKSLRESGRWRGELCDLRKNGEEFTQRLSISAVRDASGAVTHYVGMFSDISALKRAEARLQHLAHYDPLTGLPNRALFEDRLQIAIHGALRHLRQTAVLFVDLDHFKYVNDTFGHRTGDELLIEVSRRLQDIVRLEDTVARLAGDEFTLILNMAGPETADHVAKRIVDTLSQRISVGDQDVFISASVGAWSQMTGVRYPQY